VAVRLVRCKKEKVVSYILIGLVFIYSMSLLLFEKYSRIGILIFYVSLFAICIEFLFLAKSTIKGTIFDQALSPSIALIVGGIVVFFGIQSGTLSLKFDLNTHLYTVLAGVALFFAYSSSAMRYKLLPPGIADSPTIVAFLFIYIFEVLLGAKIFNYIELLAASIIMLFSIWLVMAKVQEAKKGVVFE